MLREIEAGFPLDPDGEAESSPTGHRREGGPRKPGSWPLAFLAFTLTPGSSVLAWVDSVASTDIWRACGFSEVPSYKTVNRRFNEMMEFVEQTGTDGQPAADEQLAVDGFLGAGRGLIRRARAHEPEVGRAVAVDGTATATRAALLHCCPRGTVCGERQAAKARARAQKGAERTAPKAAGHGSRIMTMPVQEANAARHAEQAQAADTPAPKSAKKRSLRRLDEGEVERLGLDPSLLWWSQPDARGGLHYYCCRDRTIGLRNHAKTERGRGKFWSGWTTQKATDVFTGGPLAVHVDPADRQGYRSYRELMDSAHETLAISPQVVSGDRGLAVKDVYTFNTRRGIASALPWRQTIHNRDRGDLENAVVDRHGVPRCKHCGAEGKTTGSGLGFTVTAHGTPVIRFRCRGKYTPECRGIQSVRCEHEPRLLQPLTLTDPVYNQAREAHENIERVHLHDRQRYTVGGREVVTRDHRIGVRWQILRQHAAMFLDWLRICLRNGWFASLRARTNPNDPTEVSAGGRLKAVLGARAKYQLALPYGPQAARIRLGFHDPPWITKPPPRTRRNGKLRF
ncbi:MAG: hypothetical protein ACLP01_10075 [Solirubrobacteraceae bacterium]